MTHKVHICTQVWVYGSCGMPMVLCEYRCTVQDL